MGLRRFGAGLGRRFPAAVCGRKALRRLDFCRFVCYNFKRLEVVACAIPKSASVLFFPASGLGSRGGARPASGGGFSRRPFSRRCRGVAGVRRFSPVVRAFRARLGAPASRRGLFPSRLRRSRRGGGCVWFFRLRGLSPLFGSRRASREKGEE